VMEEETRCNEREGSDGVLTLGGCQWLGEAEKVQDRIREHRNRSRGGGKQGKSKEKRK